MQKISGGKDIVQYATACSDTIPDLHVFKVSCKPIFLFMAAGVPVSFVHGANGTWMRDVIKSQVVNELKVLSGEGERKAIILNDAIPTLDFGLDEEGEEEKRKKNVKSLKNSIISKNVFK